MKTLAAVLATLIIYFLGLKISYELIMLIAKSPLDWQIVIVALMGVFSASLVKIFLETKCIPPLFGNMTLLLLGIIFGVAGLVSYAKDFGIMDCGFSYWTSFLVLSVTAFIFGMR